MILQICWSSEVFFLRCEIKEVQSILDYILHKKNVMNNLGIPDKFKQFNYLKNAATETKISNLRM